MNKFRKEKETKEMDKINNNNNRRRDKEK